MHACICGIHSRIPQDPVASCSMESAQPAGDDRTHESSRAAGGVGLLVLSAWCLGVLNRHRRFLLSYTAPVACLRSDADVIIAHGFAPDASLLAVVRARQLAAG